MDVAIKIFTESVTNDCLSLWPKVKSCIEKNGYKVSNNDNGFAVWYMGLLALDTLNAYQVLEPKITDSISRSVDYYFDFRIEELKDWPSELKEMYEFFTYLYLNIHQKYLENPVPQNIPSLQTSMAILLGIIQGYEGIKAGNMMPVTSANMQGMFDEFYTSIVLNSLGRWKNITSNYKVKWLL